MPSCSMRDTIRFPNCAILSICLWVSGPPCPSRLPMFHQAANAGLGIKRMALSLGYPRPIKKSSQVFSNPAVTKAWVKPFKARKSISCCHLFQSQKAAV